MIVHSTISKGVSNPILKVFFGALTIIFGKSPAVNMKWEENDIKSDSVHVDTESYQSLRHPYIVDNKNPEVLKPGVFPISAFYNLKILWLS